MGPVRGTVTKIMGASSTVDCGPAGVFQCGLRSRLSRKGGVRLAVGDRVMVTPSDVGSGETAVPAPGMIEEVDPRRTVLRRGHDRERGHIVCANVDRIFIVVAVSDPPYNRSFIDRLIVGVERDGLAPVVVVNKIDLADRESQALLARDMAVYGALGYPALLIVPRPAEDRRGAEAFRGRISAVVGPSGAGKSSLLNLVSPGASRLIGRVSDHDGRGRHTTTAAELLPLVDGP
jgi:ribosome biogenesis GTPase